MLLSEFLIPLDIRETMVVKVPQILWSEDRHVRMPFPEHIFLEIGVRIFLILFERPDVFLGAQLVVVVKAIDELFPMNILLVLGTPIPQMNMAIDNKDLFSGFGRKHMGSLCISFWGLNYSAYSTYSVDLL
jgi:hypothetical protein